MPAFSINWQDCVNPLPTCQVEGLRIRPAVDLHVETLTIVPRAILRCNGVGDFIYYAQRWAEIETYAPPSVHSAEPPRPRGPMNELPVLI